MAAPYRPLLVVLGRPRSVVGADSFREGEALAEAGGAEADDATSVPGAGDVQAAASRSTAASREAVTPAARAVPVR
ncbi:hypothetical protein CO540_09980 [Micromonospora sp. WMMA2032]|nr:hypothetical protein CO540_09980 [Micromonospora sp. WMMA2032]